MPIFEINLLLVAVLNVVLIPITHLVISYFTIKIPRSYFEKERWWSKERAFEKGGRFYEKYFFIKAWKKYLPDGAKLFTGGFAKKHFEEFSMEYIDIFIAETRRAEWSHYVQILPAALFYLFNPLWAAYVVTGYFILANLAPIVTQRHTRPRLMKLKKRAQGPSTH